MFLHFGHACFCRLGTLATFKGEWACDHTNGECATFLTFLAILFIPLFYVLISRLSREKEGNIAEDLKREEEENNSEK